MDSIEQRVKRVIREQLGVEEQDIKNESTFVSLGAEDALEMHEVIMALENEFGLKIPDTDAAKITTVQQAIDYMTSHSTAE